MLSRTGRHQGKCVKCPQVISELVALRQASELRSEATETFEEQIACVTFRDASGVTEIWLRRKAVCTEEKEDWVIWGARGSLVRGTPTGNLGQHS